MEKEQVVELLKCILEDEKVLNGMPNWDECVTIKDGVAIFEVKITQEFCLNTLEKLAISKFKI